MEEKVQFKAEIRQLLDILIHSLYTEREIFLRELVSNASDAINQLRFEQLTNQNIHDKDAELAITLTVDADAKTLTIKDSGIGMTAEQLQENLGTIARSGARAFLDAAAERGEDASDIIGRFGVGFYSVFMVADEVRVTSRSYQPDAEAATWVSDGGDEYTILSADQQERGTTIQIQLKDDATEFAEFFKIRQIIKQHSDYVEFPIYVEKANPDEEESERTPVNQQTALWRKSPREVEVEEYKSFYQQLTFDFQEPQHTIHYVADAPVQLYSLLFIPTSAEPGMMSIRREDGLKLYNRKVLIQEYTKDLLPEYFRFVRGVVDSEDLPLNVSRESVQNSPIIGKLKSTITKKILRELKSLAKDSEKYTAFWESLGIFLKEGVATDPEQVEKLLPLLRFKSTTETETWTSLPDYVSRMPEGQDAIYYILGDDAQSIQRSPHLDYFRKNGYEVLLFSDPVDPFMMQNASEFDGKAFKNVAAADTELPEANANASDEAQEEALEDASMAEVIVRFKTQLADKVEDVRTTARLSDSPARLVDPEGAMNQEMQRMYRMMERDFEAPKKILELNPSHAIVKKIAALPNSAAMLSLMIEQVYDNALLIEGLHPDPASMIARIQQLMQAVES